MIYVLQISSCGFFTALKEMGVLDVTLYQCGLSGNLTIRLFIFSHFYFRFYLVNSEVDEYLEKSVRKL